MNEDHIKEVFDRATLAYIKEIRLALQMCRDAERSLFLMNLDNRETLDRFHKARKGMIEAYLNNLENLNEKGLIAFDEWLDVYRNIGAINLKDLGYSKEEAEKILEFAKMK